VLENVGRHSSILAGTEFVKAIHFKDKISLRDLESSNEKAGVLDLINIEVDHPFHWIHPLGFVINVIPTGWIIQAADLIDPAATDGEKPTVQFVLFRRIDPHLCPRLRARTCRWRLLSGRLLSLSPSVLSTGDHEG
jgi:hypothetical protein